MSKQHGKNKMHVRRNDEVEVITGEYKGVRGQVLRSIPKRRKIVVEGVNMAYKHVKPSRENPQGGRLQRERPIDASNVMLLCQNGDCERYDKPVRTQIRMEDDGSKSRVCIKCKQPIMPSE